MSNLKKWWKANQVAAVTGVLVLLVVAFPVGSFLKAQTVDPCDFNGDGFVDDYEASQCGGTTPACADIADGCCMPGAESYDPDCTGGTTAGFCGDGLCDGAIGEDEYSCSIDCPATTAGFCGDGLCDPALAEDSASCPADCGGEILPDFGSITDSATCSTQGGMWCEGEGSPNSCFPPDYACSGAGTACTEAGGDCCVPGSTTDPDCVTGCVAPAFDCPSIGDYSCSEVPCSDRGTAAACNYNGACDTGEDSYNCPEDCGATADVCGDGVCGAYETGESCPSDCGQGAQGKCNWNNICEEGETPDSCTDCKTSDVGVECGSWNGQVNYCASGDICADAAKARCCPAQTPVVCDNGQCVTAQVECGESSQTTQCGPDEQVCPDPMGWGPGMCVPSQYSCPTAQNGKIVDCGGALLCEDNWGGWCEYWNDTCPQPTTMGPEPGMEQMPPMTDDCPGRMFCGNEESGKPVCVDWGMPCPMICPQGERVCTDDWGGEYCSWNGNCDMSTTGPEMGPETGFGGPCDGGPCPFGCYDNGRDHCPDPFGGPGYCVDYGESCHSGEGPEFDFDKFEQRGVCDPRDPFCQQGKEVDRFESKMDMYVKDDYDKRQIGDREAKRECKQLSREVKDERRWLKDVDREFKRLDWTVQSPILANAKAILDESKDVLDETGKFASSCNVSSWGDIEQVRDKLDYFRTELRPEFDDLRQDLHVFEDLKEFGKEIKRMLKDVAHERKRFEKENATAECTAYLVEASTALQALQEDPLANIDTTYGFDNRDLWDQLDNIRWEYFEPAFDCHGEYMQTNQMGQQFDEIEGELAKMGSAVPKDLEDAYKKAKELTAEGKSCFEAGDYDCAKESLDKLDRMKGIFERYMGPIGGPKFGVSVEDVLDSFDEKLASMLEEKIFAKMTEVDRIVNAMVDQVMNRVMEQMAAVIDKVSDQVATTLAKVSENITYAPVEIQEKAAETEEEKLETVEEVANVVEAKAEELSNGTKNAVQGVMDDFAAELWTSDTIKELKPRIGGIADLIENGAEDDEIIAEAREVKTLITDAKKDEQAKRYAEGFVPFTDVDPDNWFMGYAHESKELGQVKGEGGTNELNPSGDLLGAHEVTILARELGVDDECTEPRVPVDGAVDWVKPAICGLQKRFGDDVLDVIDRPLDQPITREDVAELQVKLLNLPVPEDPDAVLRSFPDKDRMSPEAKAAIAATVEAGIFKGDDAGTFRPQDGMNRAEGVKVNTIAHDIVESEAVINE